LTRWSPTTSRQRGLASGAASLSTTADTIALGFSASASARSRRTYALRERLDDNVGVGYRAATDVFWLITALAFDDSGLPRTRRTPTP
jgi:hypothetical protein